MTPSLPRLATLVHKWLALVVGAQILFWVASGLFFTLYPIETVRSENLIRQTPKQEIVGPLADVTAIRDDEGRAPVKATIDQRSGGAIVVAEFAKGPPALYDATTLRRLSPLSAEDARKVAAAHVTLRDGPLGAERVVRASPEYGGALPAWRVRFKERGLAVYVAENTGQVTARRSDLWRLYDTLWALHIMDWRDHENFNHPLIKFAAALALLSTVAGLILLPFRIRVGSRAKA